MTSTPIPRYSISALNQAVGNLLERGFAPRFLLDATVISPQLKRGHLWMTLTDGEATIGAVVWASQRARLSHEPRDGDGVVIVGKLNFWMNRASLSVQVLEIRPSLSTVLRQFEEVGRRLAEAGLLDPARKRPIPPTPGRIAVLTSVPSSALADLLRTAAERWPATSLLVVPIPVQGPVADAIVAALAAVSQRAQAWGIEAVVLARGGGSREDLAVFDSEAVARAVVSCAVPVVSGLGHEDDTTVVDLVADRRAATPTAAMVALLPDRLSALASLARLRTHLDEHLKWRLSGEHRSLQLLKQQLAALHPSHLIQRRREDLAQRRLLLEALAPHHWLARGFVLLRDCSGQLITSVSQTKQGETMQAQLCDGVLDATITMVTPGP